MTRILLPYIHEFKDRHGNVLRYFRRKGRKQVRLRGQPGSAMFMAAYHAALENHAGDQIGKRAAAGTVGALVSAYMMSAAFRKLAPDTQKARRGILERFRNEHGHRRFADLERPKVQELIDAKAATPSAARNFLNTLKVLSSFAMTCGIRDDDPTIGVKRLRIKTTGLRTWTDEDIAAFESTHPVGTPARIAMALMLYTGQRRSDVFRLGPQNIRDECIELRQQKTGRVLAVPIHPDLRKIIDQTPSKHLAFVATASGKPFRSAASFGNWFSECCRLAGLPKGTAAHGFRKAACRRLAEAGCTPQQIMAISGHVTLSEVQRYCAQADQVRMAREAQAKLLAATEGKTRTSSGKP